MELNVEENQLKLMKYLYLKSKCVHVPYEKKLNTREIVVGDIYRLYLFET